MLEYHDSKLCIPAKELIEAGVMSQSTYKNLLRRNKLASARTARGLGNYALVVVNSLPEEYQDRITRIYPHGDKVLLLGWLKENYVRDQHAVVFFMNREQCGVELSAEKINEYVTNASVLNTCINLYNNARAIQKTMGEKYDWAQMSEAIDGLRELYGHTLPSSTLRFRKKVAEYRHDGYACLISGKFGNQNKRKVDKKTLQLLLALAILPNKPFNSSVLEMYNSFVCGELDVFDPESGELFNPNDFTDQNGEPIVLSESTICNYLNMPKNRLLIEHASSDYTTFMHEQAPHVHRHAPEYSFSKVSFDDRDLPRKLKDTKIRPKAYYAYDVASQCVVGYAYNRNKNVDLVVDCFRDMFRLIDRNGWYCPAQVEVENHLMAQWKDSFLKAGTMFPFVRFCAPQNSQEKFAEPMNGAKKRSIEHKNHLGIGRFYAKGRQYRTTSKKVFDEYNDTYLDKEYYTWDELIAEDRKDIAEWNNTLHPNQKIYPGMTRQQVLESNMNPTLKPVDKTVLAKYIGEHVQTSIRRNSYCRVSYKDWWLSNTAVIERLQPNNWDVDAYYLTDATGEYNEVYIYQNDRYIDTLQYVGTFNTADAEQTAEDKQIFKDQQKKIVAFGKYLNDNELRPVGILRSQTVSVSEVSEQIVTKKPPEKSDFIYDNNFSAQAIQDA